MLKRELGVLDEQLHELIIAGVLSGVDSDECTVSQEETAVNMVKEKHVLDTKTIQ